jgi:very-short-patch-repair endonuclease
MTGAERILWLALRDRRVMGVKFLRQVPIDNCIVDFPIRRARLVVEIDGGQHDASKRGDERRTARLKELGDRVIRFWNNEVLTNTEGELVTILQEPGVDPAAPSPRASGERAGGEGSLNENEKPC